MRLIIQSVIDFLRAELVGMRVRLVSTTDPYTTLVAGDEGVVNSVDDVGTVHVTWDNGSSLGLVHGEDLWLVLGADKAPPE